MGQTEWKQNSICAESVGIWIPERTTTKKSLSVPSTRIFMLSSKLYFREIKSIFKMVQDPILHDIKTEQVLFV